jgi:hypothetical protein
MCGYRRRILAPFLRFTRSLRHSTVTRSAALRKVHIEPRPGRDILRGVPALDLGGRRWWTMSRLLRVGEKVINLDNIEYIIREDDGVVRIHFIHGDLALWNEQGEAFRQWVLSNAEYCEGSGEGW